MTANEQSNPSEIIGVVGAGAMGGGIAQLFSVAGYQTHLYDASAGAAEDSIRRTEHLLRRRFEQGKSDSQALDAFRKNASVVQSLGDLQEATIVFEAIIEDLEAKRNLFHQLEEVVSRTCVIATNTSSLLLTSISAQMKHMERALGAHFFNPVPLIPIAEVITTARTSQVARDRLITAIRATGHRAVPVADSPGFLVNHAGRGLYTEGASIVQDGVTDPKTVDRILSGAIGFKMGPFRLFDLTGLDVSFPVLEMIYHGFYQEPRFRPASFLKQRFEAGLFGRKSGEGFYRYPEDEADQVGAQRQARAEPAREVYMPASALARFEWVKPWLTERGVTIRKAPFKSKDGLNLIAPIGTDATTEATDLGLPLNNTVAFDPVVPEPREATLMATIGTEDRWLHVACSTVRPKNGGVSVIEDSPGFVVQRVIASIVNIGCDIAQQRIARPQDIDDAVRIGLNYPMGPLSLGDRFSPSLICEILDALHVQTGDPRYRVSLWLRRRALAGKSLLHMRPRAAAAMGESVREEAG